MQIVIFRLTARFRAVKTMRHQIHGAYSALQDSHALDRFFRR